MANAQIVFKQKPVLRDYTGKTLPDATHYQAERIVWVKPSWRVCFDLLRLDENGRWYRYDHDCDDDYPQWKPLGYVPKDPLPLEISNG